MILAIDAYYFGEQAKVVGLVFKDWKDTTPFEVKSIYLDAIAPYEPGSFYKRELPCIQALLTLFDLNSITLLLIDGYVYLNDARKLGLGAYLHQALEGKIPVVGVAKTSFHSNTSNVVQVVRGESKNPLYVTAVGTDLEAVAQGIQTMHGAYRIPYLLKLLDQITKQIEV